MQQTPEALERAAKEEELKKLAEMDYA